LSGALFILFFGGSLSTRRYRRYGHSPNAAARNMISNIVGFAFEAIVRRADGYFGLRDAAKERRPRAALLGLCVARHSLGVFRLVRTARRSGALHRGL
jgi:hypothetical protein